MVLHDLRYHPAYIWKPMILCLFLIPVGFLFLKPFDIILMIVYTTSQTLLQRVGRKTMACLALVGLAIAVVGILYPWVAIAVMDAVILALKSCFLNYLQYICGVFCYVTAQAPFVGGWLREIICAIWENLAP